MGNERRKDPNYVKPSEAPQVHANNSNNRPPSVAELLSKLDGLRQQVADAVKRHDTGRPTKSHSQKGLRRATRETSAEVSRRGGDPRPHKGSQPTSPQVEQESASVAAESRHASRDSGQRAGIEVAQPLSAEALSGDAPRTLDYERDPRRIKAFLRYMQRERIRAVYIDGELLEVSGIFPGINVLHCTDPYGLIPISEDKWAESIVSLDKPPSADTPRQNDCLPRGASIDECKAFFDGLTQGTRLVAIGDFGRCTSFEFSRYVCHSTEGFLTVFSLDERKVFYSDVYDFELEGPEA